MPANVTLKDVDLTSLGNLNGRRPNEDPEKIVKRHIELLHKYNEAKDATQVRFSLFIFRRKAPLILNFSRVGLDGLDSDWKGGRLNHLFHESVEF